jgi:hypothetical protein
MASAPVVSHRQASSSSTFHGQAQHCGTAKGSWALGLIGSLDRAQLAKGDINE